MIIVDEIKQKRLFTIRSINRSFFNFMGIGLYLVKLILLFFVSGFIFENDCVAAMSKKHILVVARTGSHSHPLQLAIKMLVLKGAKVTFLTESDTHNDAMKIKSYGADVLKISEEVIKVSSQLTKKQVQELLWDDIESFIRAKNPNIRLTDGTEKDVSKTKLASIQFSTVLGQNDLGQYKAAILWEELLAAVKNLRPDVIVFDSDQAGWAKYVARLLKIPAFASCAPGIANLFFEPNFHDLVKGYFAEKYPPTGKREWAIGYLKNILGPIDSRGLDVNHVITFSDPDYATFVYTYPLLEGFRGTHSLNTNLVFVGYKREEKELTSDEEIIVNEIVRKKKGKKLIFISMGTDSTKDMEFFHIMADAFGDKKGSDGDIVVALHPGPKVAGESRHNVKKVSEYIKNLGYNNFIVKDFFPLPVLFKHVDLFIGHGGFNSSMQAALKEVPIILMPGHGDQFIVAKKFQDSGLAKEVPIDLNALTLQIDKEKWSKFTNSHKRKELVVWLQENTKKLLKNKKTDKNLFKGAVGYDKMTDIILS